MIAEITRACMSTCAAFAARFPGPVFFPTIARRMGSSMPAMCFYFVALALRVNHV